MCFCLSDISKYNVLYLSYVAKRKYFCYSPHNAPKNNSLISCDYIIESKLSNKNTIVYIFIKRRQTDGNSFRIISFGVKKKVSYGGIYTYVMLKDKIVNTVRKTIFRHKKYTDEQAAMNENNKE